MSLRACFAVSGAKSCDRDFVGLVLRPWRHCGLKLFNLVLLLELCSELFTYAGLFFRQVKVLCFATACYPPQCGCGQNFFDLILYTCKNCCTGYFSIFRKHRLVPVYQAVPAAAGNRSGLLVIFWKAVVLTRKEQAFEHRKRNYLEEYILKRFRQIKVSLAQNAQWPKGGRFCDLVSETMELLLLESAAKTC